MQSEWASQTLGPRAITHRGQNKTRRVDPAMKVSSLHFGGFWGKQRRCYMKGFTIFLLEPHSVHEPDSESVDTLSAPYGKRRSLRSWAPQGSTLSAPLRVQVNNFSCLQRAVSAPHKKVNTLYASRCLQREWAVCLLKSWHLRVNVIISLPCVHHLTDLRCARI